MVIKVGKDGKCLAGSGFPECRGTKRLVKDTGGICPKCGKGRMLERKSSKAVSYTHLGYGRRKRAAGAGCELPLRPAGGGRHQLYL